MLTLKGAQKLTSKSIYSIGLLAVAAATFSPEAANE